MTLRKLTVREALREAMAEEMRLDNKIFVMGEEVAEYNAAYKVTQVSIRDIPCPALTR